MAPLQRPPGQYTCFSQLGSHSGPSTCIADTGDSMSACIQGLATELHLLSHLLQQPAAVQPRCRRRSEGALGCSR